MFPLFIVAALVMGAAAMGSGKRRRKVGVTKAPNFVLIHNIDEYDKLVQRGVFNKPTIAVFALKEDDAIISFVRQTAQQVPDVFFLVASGEEARAFMATWSSPEDMAFIYNFTIEELAKADPLTIAQTIPDVDESTDIWIISTIDGLPSAMASSINAALSREEPQPTTQPQPKVQPKPEAESKWSPFPTLKKMQEGLISLGFSVGPKGADGLWGNKTKNGVKDFQVHVNDMYGMDLREDGDADPPTRTAIGVGLDLLSKNQWTFPGEKQVPITPPEAPEGQWEPEDWDEVTWSDKLFVAPDCSRVIHGNFWASQRLNPLVIAVAKEGGEVFAEDILDAELAKDSPFCVDAGYENWGPEMQEWYDTWADLIYQDLEIYADNPELLGE